MNPYNMECTCEVCGEGGMGTIRTAAAMWDPNQRVAHSDPDICRRNLERKAKRLAKKEKEIEQRSQEG